MWRLPTPEFKVLLYGPDLPPAGLRARAHFEPGVLVIQGKGHWYTIQSDRISLKTGGYDGRQWLISWNSPDGPATAMLQGDDAVDAFIKLVPPGIAGELHRVRKAHLRRGWGFRLAMVMIGLTVLLPALAMGLFWINGDRFSQWAVRHVSLEQEKRLGELAFDQVRSEMTLIEEGPAKVAVELIGVRLTAGGRRFDYRFHVAKDPRINAFALPGGHVVVFSGLLKSAENADEVAGVLAHEASHVEKRHALRSIIHALGWRAVLGVALGDYSVGIWGDMSRKLGNLKYSRDMEREADREALSLLRRAGLPAAGMFRFYERAAYREKAQAPLLSSHPAGMERLADLGEAIENRGQYTSRSMQLDWVKVRQDLAQREVK
jgi:Zn-dependent protease with chaperone function